MQNASTPQIPQARPSAQFCADARKIVDNPADYADRPILRRLAWTTLMAQRGRTVDQAQLARMALEVAHGKAT